jgi:choline monooxygenase
VTLPDSPASPASSPILSVDPDIRRASSPPATFYRDPTVYARLRERVLARAWHLVGDAAGLTRPGQVLPAVIQDGCLDEPVVLTRGPAGELHCLSNVCTHRGNLVVTDAACLTTLRCGYHGRRFGLDGRFLSMPEFQEALDFPSERDHLPRLALERWGRFLFASLDPAFPFAELMAGVGERLGWISFDELELDPVRSRDYQVEAHWALYVENYLEGFHIPFVHPALARTVDYASYRTVLMERASLQIGLLARPGEVAFEPPSGSPDHGQQVAGYYLFLFPNLMFNVYPGGLSINVVEPLGPDRTRVRYLIYGRPGQPFDQGASAGLDAVELEDESVVATVQRGLRSRLYRGGRYSPSRETAVHHFHRQLAALLG